MRYIKQEIVERIKENSDLMAVISDYVDLKKTGTNYVGLSPFADEKTPSFLVSPSKGIWKDFSSGKGGNSAVSFLMEIDNISYPEAIEYLAAKGFDPQFGARPVKRVVQREVLNKLSKEILAGSIHTDSIILLDEFDQELVFRNQEELAQND